MPSGAPGADSASPKRAVPPLTIVAAGRTYTVQPGDGPIIVGREFPAQVLIDDPRISRTHLRIELRDDRWTARDSSSNGSYVDGEQQQSVVIRDGMTIRLGHPQGIPVLFNLAARQDVLHTPVPADDADSDSDRTPDGQATDPGIARAGAAVAARRRELDIAQRTLARDKVINAGALIAFEKGRSWPHRSTQDKLERVLGWPPGTISRIRDGADAPTEPPTASPAAESPAPTSPPSIPTPVASEDTGETTNVVITTVEAPLMAETVGLALGNIQNTIAALPAPDDPSYGERVSGSLRDLRRVETLAANTARAARGATEVALVLSRVRKTYRDLMLAAARSPQATLGQRLYAARHHAELTAEEAASAAGVSVADITTVEADGLVEARTAQAVEALLAMLSAS
ncbi:FHA domain-containing protein [Mycobacterium sp. GA-2829]|uniref:FHA domain-containing protein n=1 Tax=Mycobacterium sp. GA-2829 TaxID=1772283 RepID=UPI00073FC221|nr:FHA domain-containing protein [Mycobacterium sp. GA-2829]KUI36249.1 hypothetical protein AU194_16180 [Mycobacterium sp. GA-2829]